MGFVESIEAATDFMNTCPFGAFIIYIGCAFAVRLPEMLYNGVSFLWSNFKHKFIKP